MSDHGGPGAASVAGARRHVSRIPDEEEATIARLAAEGATIAWVSRQLGRPIGTVKRLFWERGLTPVAQEARMKRDSEAVRRIAASDRSLNDIRRILHEGGVSLSRPRIRRIVADLGLPHWQQPSPPRPEVAKTILERARSGQFRRSVARETGTTLGQVARVLKKAVEAGRLTSRKNDRPWSRSDVAALERLGRDGATHRAIADRLGRSAGAVSAKLHEIGKASSTGENSKRTLRRWTLADVDDAKDRRRRGESPAEIALALGRSERSVKDRLAGSSTSMAPDPWSAVEAMALARLDILGYRSDQIARAIDRPLSSVKSRLATLRKTRGKERRTKFSNNGPWSEAETALLLRLKAARLPPNVIAIALDRLMADIGARLIELSAAPVPRERPPAPGGRSRRALPVSTN